MELAALFWGGAFLSVLILSWTTVFLARRKILNIHPDPLEGMENLPEPRSCLEPVRINFNFTLPGIFLPALRYELEVKGTFTPGRTMKTSTFLYSGENRGYLQWQGPRGVYESYGPQLKIGDYWGFIQSNVTCTAPGSLTILPDFPPGEGLEPFSSGKGDRASRSHRRERNSELLEVRKYYPGDDFRRINWKVYAHVGELFLRIGEENPPPEAQIGLVFDLGASGFDLASGLEEEFLDHRIAHFGAAARSLKDKGYEVVVMIPGHPQPVTWGEDSLGIKSILAGLKTHLDPLTLVVPSPPLSPVVLFTHPLSPTTQDLEKTLETLGSRVLRVAMPWPWSPIVSQPWYMRKNSQISKREQSLKLYKKIYQAKEDLQ